MNCLIITKEYRMKKALITFILLITLSLSSIISFANQPSSPSPAVNETTESHSGSFFTGALLILLSLSAGISTKRIYEMRRSAIDEIA